MNYYVVNLLIVIGIYIMCCLAIKEKQKRGKVFLILSMLQLFFMLALRKENVGIDLQNYIPFLNRVINFTNAELFTIGFESGYNIYCKFIMQIFNNEQIFLAITAGISLIGVYFFIKNNSNNYFLSMIIYITFQFYIFLFSGLRQSIALSIILLSIKYIKTRKIYKFIVMILLASLFHKSAFIFLPAYFIAYKKITVNYLITIVGAGGIIFILRNKIMTIITRFLYTNYEALQNQGEGFGYLILLILILLLALYFIKAILKQNKDNIIWYNLLIVAIIIQLLASMEGNVARLTMYYSISIVVMIPNVLEIIKPKELSYVGKIILGVCLCIFFYKTMQNPILYMPYLFFWQ